MVALDVLAADLRGYRHINTNILATDLHGYRQIEEDFSFHPCAKAVCIRFHIGYVNVIEADFSETAYERAQTERSQLA